jgi:hypothetical protein
MTLFGNSVSTFKNISILVKKLFVGKYFSSYMSNEPRHCPNIYDQSSFFS